MSCQSVGFDANCEHQKQKEYRLGHPEQHLNIKLHSKRYRQALETIQEEREVCIFVLHVELL